MRLISFLIIFIAIALYYRVQIVATLEKVLLKAFEISNLTPETKTNKTIVPMSDLKGPKNTTYNNSTDFAGLPLIPPNDPSLEATDEMALARGIKKVFLATAKSEGVGARVRRSIGNPELRNFTPFLMLDHFSVAEGAGFPDHPHRHFETVTYMLSGGGIDHEDFAGNKGTIFPGDLQFMTAGKGIVHAEMPHPTGDGSPNVGMQLWVDLPKQLKYCDPRYRDLRASEIPIDTSPDGKVIIKVIAGQTKSGVISQQNLSYTPIWFFDIQIKPGGKLIQPLPRSWNAFAYLIDGSVIFDTDGKSKKVDQYHMTVFESKGDRVTVQVPEDASSDARFLLVAGLPLSQPVFQYGPFVATSQEEIMQALSDYQSFSNGFEKAKDFESTIGKRMAY